VESGETVPDAPEVPTEKRIDPILPVVVQSVKEAPEREAGRLAFGGIIEDEGEMDGQLPLIPKPEGPRVPLLELVDWHGIPTTAGGRGAPMGLGVYVGATVLTPLAARSARGRLVTTVRELRDFLFGRRWRAGASGGRPGDWERMRRALREADQLWLPLENGDLWRAVAVRRLPPEDVVARPPDVSKISWGSQQQRWIGALASQESINPGLISGLPPLDDYGIRDSPGPPPYAPAASSRRSR